MSDNSDNKTGDGGRRVVVVTGGTSGIGLECCRALVQHADIHTIIVGRDATRVQQTVDSLSAVGSVEGEIADLASLASVRALVERLIASKRKLFALVCNAGISQPVQLQSVDGFETTFATNHLGHFLLATSLQSAGMFASGQQARLIVLASSLHDPEVSAQARSPPPDISDWERVAHGGDEKTWPGRTAYSTSKLCNVLFANECQRRFGDNNELRVYTYSPGFIPDTGLFRSNSAIVWGIVSRMIKLVAYFNPNFPISTAEHSGGFLARLASDAALPWDSGSYFKTDALFHPSEQSKDPQVAKELWEKSIKWVGL